MTSFYGSSCFSFSLSSSSSSLPPHHHAAARFYNPYPFPNLIRFLVAIVTSLLSFLFQILFPPSPVSEKTLRETALQHYYYYYYFFFTLSRGKMSLHRRQSRARLIANRANTLPPLLQENGSPGMSICSPSIEESLQDWLSRSRTGSDSPTAWLTDASCPCCGEPGCDRYESIAQTVKKLEGDARLAAGKLGFSPPLYVSS